MEMYKRKLVLLGLIIAIYCLVSFWVPYSKYWFMKDIMQTQARMYFAMQSAKDCRDLLIRKAEALDVLANGLGAALGVGVAALLSLIKNRAEVKRCL